MPFSFFFFFAGAFVFPAFRSSERKIGDFTSVRKCADFRILAEISLDTQDRLNHSEKTTTLLLPAEDYEALHGAKLPTIERFTRELQQGGALVLGPARGFTAAATEFKRQGFQVRFFETPQMNLFIIVSPSYSNEVLLGTEPAGW